MAEHENQYSEQLHGAILRWVADMNDENLGNVCNTLVEACIVGDEWAFPIATPNIRKANVYTTSEYPGQVKLQMTDRSGKTHEALVAITEEARMRDNPMWFQFCHIPCEKILETFVNAPKKIDRLYLNPNSEIFYPISKEFAQDLLENVRKVREALEKEKSGTGIGDKIAVTPNIILSESQYRADLHEACGKKYGDAWSLVAYPLNADGTLILHFVNSDDGTMNCALLYTIKGKSAKRKDYFFFRCPNTVFVRKFFYRRAKFYALLENDKGQNFLQRFEDNGNGVVCHIPSDVSDAEMDAKGLFGCGLNKARQHEDGAKYAAYWFSLSKDSGGTFDEKADISACSAVSVTPDGYFAWHSSPSDYLCISDEEGFVAYKVDRPGFDGFAFSNDGSGLMVSYTEDSTHFSLGFMVRNEEDEYVHCVPVVSYAESPLPDPEKAEVFGNPSMLGSTFVLNFDGDLYIYDINSCVKNVENKTTTFILH